jgi:hypothetical protein
MRTRVEGFLRDVPEWVLQPSEALLLPRASNSVRLLSFAPSDSATPWREPRCADDA